MRSVFTETGLNLPENTTEEEFFEVGRTLHSVTVGLQWALGDWYNSIPWGDKQAACEEAGIKYSVASGNAFVCSAFPDFANRKILNYSSAKLLSNQSLTDDQRSALVEKTRKEGWTGPVLKLEINKELGIEEPVAVVEFEKHGDEAIEVISTYMPKAASKKLTSAINREVKKLVKVVGHDFYGVVKKEVDIQVSRDRDRMKKLTAEAKAEKANFKRLTTGVHRIISEEEFKLIRSCLHPDKHPGEDKYQRAFEAFNRMADKFKETFK